MSVSNYNPTTYEYTPPDLHPDYDWSDGLQPGSFSTSRTKLGGRLLEELLQACPEVGIELKRLAKLHYAEPHQHKLRSLIKMVFDTEYLDALNRGSFGTQEWEEKKQLLIEQHHSYAAKWYGDDAARIKREFREFTQRLAEIEESNKPKTDTDAEYLYISDHVHRHVDIIAYWCMADFSRYPECWYHEEGPAEPTVSLWDMELQQAQEAERLRLANGPVSGNKVKAVRNVNKYGRPPAKPLTPEEKLQLERQRIQEEDQRRKDEEELEKVLAAHERKQRRLQEQLDTNPNIFISTDTGDDIIVAAPTTAADLAIKLGRRKKTVVPEFKTFKRTIKVVKKP